MLLLGMCRQRESYINSYQKLKLVYGVLMGMVEGHALGALCNKIAGSDMVLVDFSQMDHSWRV